MTRMPAPISAATTPWTSWAAVTVTAAAAVTSAARMPAQEFPSRSLAGVARVLREQVFQAEGLLGPV
jgi:hypothetical protein